MAKVSKSQPVEVQAEDPSGTTLLEPELLGELLGCAGIETFNHMPRVDMYSTRDELVIEVELPGVKREDIELSLFKNTIRVKAIKYETVEEENQNYVCMERAFGRIYRSIEIPFPVDTGRIKATYKNGILTVAIPRIEDRRVSVRHIPVEPL